jgi:hypothetical protein
MNMMAAPVVALLKKVDAPVLPKSVWLPPPPNAAPATSERCAHVRSFTGLEQYNHDKRDTNYYMHDNK